jgi:hypothetical protein
VRAVNDWARELYEGRTSLHHAPPAACQTPEEAVAELLRVAEFGLRPGHFRLGVRPNRSCTRSGASGRRPRRLDCRSTCTPIRAAAAPDRGRGHRRSTQSVADAGREFPMGAMAELMSAIVSRGSATAIPASASSSKKRGRLGAFMFWRLDRGTSPAGRKAACSRQTSRSRTNRASSSSGGLLHLRGLEEGGFRRVRDRHG